MRRKILLFEDSPFLLEIYMQALNNANFEVVTAKNEEELLQFSLTNPSIILIDIMAIRANSTNLVEQLKQNPQTQNIPVVILASSDQEKLITEVLKQGAKGFLLKERLTPQDLVNRIEEFLENP